MKAERKRSLIVFGDITGSTAWARRTTPEDVVALMGQIYEEFLELTKDPNLFVKILGDGFMAIRTIKDDNDHKIICQVFKKILDISGRIESHIKNSHYPRPYGFRIRAVVGPLWNMQFGPNLIHRDVIDYNVDFCSTLLGVAKEVRFIASDSVRDAFLRHRDHSIQFIPFKPLDLLKGAEKCPIVETPFYFASKIDPEDMTLWIVKMKERGRKK